MRKVKEADDKNHKESEGENIDNKRHPLDDRKRHSVSSKPKYFDRGKVLRSDRIRKPRDEGEMLVRSLQLRKMQQDKSGRFFN